MATRLKSFQMIAGAKKHLVQAVFPSASSRTTVSAAATFTSRSGHSSPYDKNVEEELQAVADEVIKPDSDKYWSPHPQTGVFGPVTPEHSPAADAARQDTAVLEETAWFRPTSLEDTDKTMHV